MDFGFLKGAPPDTLSAEMKAADQKLMQEFQIKGPWGLSTTIDLYGCDPDLIRDPLIISRFNTALCEHLQMERYGDFHLARFGKDDLEGYSGLQFIQTSNTSMHFIEPTDDACIDIFSCSIYAPYAAAEFCRQFFDAKEFDVTYTLRGRRSR